AYAPGRPHHVREPAWPLDAPPRRHDPVARRRTRHRARHPRGVNGGPRRLSRDGAAADGGRRLAAPSPRLVRSNRGGRRRLRAPATRLEEPAIAAAARLDGATLAVGAELQLLVTSRAARGTAVRHHSGPPQLPPGAVHLWRQVMRPRVRLWRATARVTR